MKDAKDGFQVDAKIRKHLPLPRWYIEEPVLLPGEDFYLIAFTRLCSERKFEMGPIPWSSIIDYGRRAQLKREVVDIFVAIIAAIDTKYLEYKQNEFDKKRKADDRAQKRKVTSGRLSNSRRR